MYSQAPRDSFLSSRVDVPIELWCSRVDVPIKPGDLMCFYFYYFHDYDLPGCCLFFFCYINDTHTILGGSLKNILAHFVAAGDPCW